MHYEPIFANFAVFNVLSRFTVLIPTLAEVKSIITIHSTPNPATSSSANCIPRFLDYPVLATLFIQVRFECRVSSRYTT